MQLAGKTVLLTGGSAGIGREIALQLKAKGARVILTGRSPERLEAMRAAGFEVIAADLSHAAGVDALIAQLADTELDVLINNAGQLVDHDFRKAAPDADAADARPRLVVQRRAVLTGNENLAVRRCLEQPGDVKQTYADVRLLKALTGYTPNTDYRDGIARFVDWYRGYYKPD